jgi:hypothetical protein
MAPDLEEGERMLAERNPSTEPMTVNAPMPAPMAMTEADRAGMGAKTGAAMPLAAADGTGMPAKTPPAGAAGENAVDAALAWHDGDPRATIETLLADCGHLRVQLAAARNCISRGLTRGWLPEAERPTGF